MSAESDSVDRINRIVRLEEERKALGGDIKDIKAELKASGLQPAAINRAVKWAMLTPPEREEIGRKEDEGDLLIRALEEAGV